MAGSAIRIYRNYTASDTTFNGRYTVGSTLPTIEDLSWSEPEGRNFKEWNSAQDGTGTSYDPGDIAEVPVYAIWIYPVEYKTTDLDLTSVADAIRAKGGTSSSLTYPTGFVNAIQAIPTGGGDTNKVYIGTCSTNATTMTKVVTVSQDQNFTLENGAVIYVYCTTANTLASSPSVVYVNINSTGAHPIRFPWGEGGSADEAYWKMNDTLTLVYDSTGSGAYILAAISRARVVQKITEGTKIAVIDGQDIYAPSGGGGAGIKWYASTNSLGVITGLYVDAAMTTTVGDYYGYDLYEIDDAIHAASSLVIVGSNSTGEYITPMNCYHDINEEEYIIYYLKKNGTIASYSF